MKTFCVLSLFLLISASFAVFTVDVESGMVFTGYNDARIPNDGGTLFSLSDELKSDPQVFGRLLLTYDVAPRHHISALFAPLTIKPTGSIDREVVFGDATFPANTPLDAVYKFNSYRLTYRYDLVRNTDLSFGLGLTLKVRDAEIKVSSVTESSSSTNLGFVPLINFKLDWDFAKPVGLLFTGDALAAPQGRAEDVLAALTLKLSPMFRLHGGYRILEGGADAKTVYTFSLFHYAVAGVELFL
jgi:hypothetical protein